MLIARAMCGLTHVTVAALCSSCSLLCISNSDWATEDEAGRSVSVNCNEETRWRELSPIEFSCDCNYSLITHNKTPVHSTWGLLRVCAACSTPRLNRSSELRPSWNNIQDTVLTGSAPDTTITINLSGWSVSRRVSICLPSKYKSETVRLELACVSACRRLEARGTPGILLVCRGTGSRTAK
jgi:hypothetical protein